MNRNTEKITVRGLQFPISRALPVNRKISQEVKNPLIFFDCDLRTKNFSEESAQTGSSSPVDSGCFRQYGDLYGTSNIGEEPLEVILYGFKKYDEHAGCLYRAIPHIVGKGRTVALQ